MTVITPENKVENSLTQDKVEINIPQTQVESTSTQISTENKPAEEVKEDPNWRAFREARKKDRLEKEVAEKRASEKEAEALALKAAMEAILNKPSANSLDNGRRLVEDSYGQDETEDERIEKKVLAALAVREAASERARAEREQQEYPQRLVQTYSDFNHTISTDNLDYLEYHYPEVAGPLKRLPDNFEKWADIYRAIKKFVPNSANAKKDAARADSNFNKPKSISSTGLTQTGESIGGSRLTEERKAANWERMERVRKGLS